MAFRCAIGYGLAAGVVGLAMQYIEDDSENIWYEDETMKMFYNSDLLLWV